MAFRWLFGAVLVTTAFAQSGKGPLYDYVFREDSNYAYAEIARYVQPGVTTYVLNMTSQQWLNESFSDRSIWFHYLAINVPDDLRFTDHGVMFLSTGRTTSNPPGVGSSHVRDMIAYSNNTGIATAVLKQTPNQPINFGDHLIEDLMEDGIIAYTWRWWLDAEDKNPEVLLRFPMCKGAKMAMDTMTTFVKSVNPSTDIQKFMMAGLSKRAWTLWLSAAIDDRVVAIAPTVLTCLNVNANFHHHYQANGGWSFALLNYWQEFVMTYMDDPLVFELEKVIDPYQYRQNLTMPKLIISGGSDEFFMMDDYDYFYDGLPGEKYIWIVEKTGHNPDSGPLKEDYWKLLETFYLSVILDHKKPEYSYYRNTTETGGSITFTTHETFTNMSAWMAITPDSVMPRRDFRLRMLTELDGVVDTGVEWNEFPMEDLGDGNYRISFDNPGTDKYLGFFVKVHFPWDEEGREFIFSSEANIIPAGFPFPDCYRTSCQGNLV